jgi:hypothetical protein
MGEEIAEDKLVKRLFGPYPEPKEPDLMFQNSLHI